MLLVLHGHSFSTKFSQFPIKITKPSTCFRSLNLCYHLLKQNLVLLYTCFRTSNRSSIGHIIDQSLPEGCVCMLSTTDLKLFLFKLSYFCQLLKHNIYSNFKAAFAQKQQNTRASTKEPDFNVAEITPQLGLNTSTPDKVTIRQNLISSSNCK